MERCTPARVLEWSEGVEGGLGDIVSTAADDDRKTLWALGYDELRAFKLIDRDRADIRLELRKTHKLPGIGGHDLRAVPQSTGLLISNKEHVYIFDRTKEQFTEHMTLGKIEKVKSIDVHPQTGQIVHSLGDRR